MNGGRCSLGLKTNITAPVTNLPAGNVQQSNLSQFLQTGYISVDGNRLVGIDGNYVTLNGANWFGFETQVMAIIDTLLECYIIKLCHSASVSVL